MVDYALLTFIVVILLPLVGFLFRKRLKRAIIAGFVEEGVLALNSMLFQQVVVEVDGKKEPQNVLTPWATGILSQAAPILVSEGMKAIKLRVPDQLPINAKGELDFMAPVIQKLASGKKVKFDDFLPVIIDKAMPYVEGFLSKAGSSSAGTASTTKNPFLKE